MSDDRYNMSNPNYTVVFFFENQELNYKIDTWMESYWFVGIFIAILYLSTVFGLKHWMTNRLKYQLKSLHILWTIFLTVLNIIATWRLIPYFSLTLQRNGLYESMCVLLSYKHDTVCGFWLRIFPYLKTIELGDTIFMVLQKRRLPVFYWYHHVIVMLYSWYMYPFYPSIAIWLAVINNASHVPVYLYASFRAIGINPPTLLSYTLLILEILQMVIGLTLCCLLYAYFAEHYRCNISFFNATVTFAMYFSFMVLCILLLHKRFYKTKSFNITVQKPAIPTIT